MLGSSVEPDLLGDDEEGVGEVDLVLEGLHLRGVGGIEDEQLGEAVDLAEGHLEHFGAQAGSAHAEQQRVLEPARLISAAICSKRCLCAS